MKEFKEACSREGVPPRLKSSVRLLFELLDDGTEKAAGAVGSLCAREVAFIDTWQIPPWMWEEPDFGAAEFFREALLARYKNPIIAWRKVLDLNSDMRVNYYEFTGACKKLAKSGMLEAHPPSGLSSLFCALDHSRSGWLSFREWDKTSYRLLARFALWTRKEHGKAIILVKAWEDEPDKGLSIETFERICHNAGLGMSPRETDTLFEGLSLKEVARKVRSDRVVKAGKITVSKMAFLDKWDIEGQIHEELAWERIARQHHSGAVTPSPLARTLSAANLLLPGSGPGSPRVQLHRQSSSVTRDLQRQKSLSQRPESPRGSASLRLPSKELTRQTSSSAIRAESPRFKDMVAKTIRSPSRSPAKTPELQSCTPTKDLLQPRD
jgi:hypothetical protein